MAVAANADCLLIGPQVRYEKDSVAEQCPGVPVDDAARIVHLVGNGPPPAVSRERHAEKRRRGNLAPLGRQIGTGGENEVRIKLRRRSTSKAFDGALAEHAEFVL